MNRGLQPVLDTLQFDGCPFCGEQPTGIQVNGPDKIILGGCGHIVDAKEWADTQVDSEP